MVQIGNVPEITEIRSALEEMTNEGLLLGWELPYENLLTRNDAAIYFLSVSEDIDANIVWEKLAHFSGLEYKENSARELSQLNWEIKFNK